MHHAALSALSCIHEDIKHYRAAALIEGSVADTLRALVSWLSHYTRKNVRQAFETLIQVVLCVPICIEDNELIQVSHLQPHAISPWDDLVKEQDISCCREAKLATVSSRMCGCGLLTCPI